ncbi:MAG: 16S rRNA (cytosine(1402)-N(4))-methyltransferase [Bacteroidetes bacterium HGW-Bacteroidetes-12]|jgi:16S rRNA (cytosine1402-N4)-methyltransferase|nr:MAG: 16S rRNA (cytosine(1402)-N(4))-methyltransferase [Bacteroidetes bacterium HGW-Bacteroidetes-12]
MYHNPVLLHESVDGLAIKANETVVDVTFGGGGHSKEILNRLGVEGKLFGFDQDEDAVQNSPNDSRFVLVKQNFRYLKNYLKLYKAIPVDAILADLGVSSHQFDEGTRGFSIRFDGPLDMRMNKNGKLTAAQIVNEYDEQKLLWIFRNYGEVNNAKRLVEELMSYRSMSKLTTTQQLIEIAEKCVPGKMRNKYLAQVFQALRIEVNDEMNALKEMIGQAYEVLKPGGKLVVITYHSLEDRLVKNYIKNGKFEGEVEKDFFGNPQLKFKAINRKPITPSEQELKQNNRARSAKLRIAEKI